MSLCAVALPTGDATAAGETRSLKLYFVHTGEKAVITFKRNGRFDPKGLQELNRFLRDWRRNEPTRMDPRLFDLVWEVYRRVGASDYIHVVSAYRSPNTNGMLRSRTKGVAKNSQHMLGKAMDFFIPGVKLTTLRETAMKLQVGGVGFYPTSGSPFVHLDVGGVRAWPRMGRQDLVRLFPDGNTMHIPADGKPLPGYEQAVADYKRRVAADSIQIAGTAGGYSSSSRGKPKNLMAMLFGGGDEDEDSEEISAPTTVAQRPSAAAAASDDGEEAAPAPVAVASAAPPPSAQASLTAAPVPQARPAFGQEPQGASFATALYSPQKQVAQQAIEAAMPAAAVTPIARPASDNAGYTDLASLSVPVPTLLGARGMKGDAQQPAAITTASLSQADTGDFMLASVPVPSARPVVEQARAQTVAAATVPETAGTVADGGKQSLTPELIDELARTAEGDGGKPAFAVPTQRPAEQQVALASPRPADTGVGGPVFNDGFDMPKQVSHSAPADTGHKQKSSAQPNSASANPMQNVRAVKGGAVTRLGGRPAAPDTKVLTGDVLAKWATSTNRAESNASVKAPRLMTRAFSAEVSSAYSGGFRPVSQAVAVDPNRFSGANTVKP